AIVRELVYLLSRIVNDPDVPLRIVGADFDAMRSATANLEQMIMLRPPLEDLAFGVGHDDAVAEHGFLPGRLFRKRPDRSIEIRWQLLGQLQLTPADQVDAIR